ncbi:MAG: hypothetical protein HY791_13550 [Deltaproteobacteria bacterium]|nr:hypothetical protein [Deltaproteobacteria bacterium]
MRRLLFPLLAAWSPLAEAGPTTLAPEPKRLVLDVGIVEDPELPALQDAMVKEALARASTTFAEKFAVSPIDFQIVERSTVDVFHKRYLDITDPDCALLFAARYHGGGRSELDVRKEEAKRFFERWPLESLISFVPQESRATVKSYDDLYDFYASHYPDTVARIRAERTEKGSPLVDPAGSRRRSYVAWSCALRRQPKLDVIITNTFILADLLTEPHPHAALGRAKIGGIAGPNPARKALRGQALLASTFGIDTSIPMLSELDGKPATASERAALLGTYLLAHEIAHAVFGIPDVFDHPGPCLMTSRPGESYREGLETLEKNPGPCPKCRPWIHARQLLDRAKEQIGRGELKDALATLTVTSTSTPKQLHGGYKRRMSEVSLLVAKAYAGLGRPSRAKTFASSATSLDPSSDEAKTFLESIERGLELASTERRLPATQATTSTRAP